LKINYETQSVAWEENVERVAVEIDKDAVFYAKRIYDKKEEENASNKKPKQGAQAKP